MYQARNYFLTILFLLFSGIACTPDYEPSDPATELLPIYEQALMDVQFLASDDLEGRKTGTEGSRLAQEYIEERFEVLNLRKFEDTYRHLFDHTNERTGEQFTDAVNLIGYVQGSEHPDRYIAITAHYDHLGIIDDEIYNGADDNASGTGGLMAAARYFTDHQPQNSLIFIAFDAEEQGLGGAYHFVENPVVPLEQIVMNVNMDMISTNFDDELYAVGTYHYPYLQPMVEESAVDAPIDILFGYDSEEWEQDWTLSSDHGPFHLKGIPFVYFGVEDHEHYHAPSDNFDNINKDFYMTAVETIVGIMKDLDARLDEVEEASGRRISI